MLDAAGVTREATELRTEGVISTSEWSAVLLAWEPRLHLIHVARTHGLVPERQEDQEARSDSNTGFNYTIAA